MIYDTLDHADSYSPLHPLFARAFQFAADLPADAPESRIEIQGDDLYAMHMSYQTSPAEQRTFEAHRNYIDLQIALDGAERLDVTGPAALTVRQPYDPDGDAILYEPHPECSSVILKPGYFTLLLPHDIHRPGCNLHSAQTVRKLVLKIHV